MHDYLAAASGSGSTLELPSTVSFNAPELVAIAEGTGYDPAVTFAVGAIAVALAIARLFGK